MPKIRGSVCSSRKTLDRLIIRAFNDGSKRFSEIVETIPSISARILTERFKEIEETGIVARIVHPETPVRIEYELTQKGKDLAAALEEIQEWANKWCKGVNKKFD